MTLRLPEQWAQWMSRLSADGGPDGATWIRSLPGLIADSLDDWDLTVTGPAMTGWTAIVLPVDRGGEPLALKVTWPHPEASGEHLALRRWAGDGAVRLIAAAPSRGAILLERLHARDLMTEWDEDAVDIIGGLLARLTVPALASVRRLSDVLDADVARYLGDDAPIPRRFVQQARVLHRDLRDTPDIDGTLLHSDLHFENVLAADREPWLAIDPKPLAGHPGWEVSPVLFNRMAEMGTGASLRWSVRRRIDLLCEHLGLDPDEARAWATLRLTVEAAADAVTGDDEWVGPKITVLKALA